MNKKSKQNKIPKRIIKLIFDNTKVCLSSSNIKSKIVNIDENMDKIIFKDIKENIIKEVRFLNFIDVEKRYFYKDLDFDGVEELLVDISSNEQRQEYEIFNIKCNTIVPFSLKTLFSSPRLSIIYRGYVERTARRDIEKLLHLDILKIEKEGEYSLNREVLEEKVKEL